jgi:HEAT repeat protein
MADPHLDVRRRARRHLRALADKKEWQDLVIAEGMRVLPGGRSWRGQEQAAILLAQLDHKPAAPALVPLLESPQPEVGISAAWALRKLNVPDTLPAVRDHVEATLALLQGGQPGREVFPPVLRGHQLSQLNQFLGRQRYAPAEPLLRKFIPRNSADAESRAAAVWALGLLHQGENDDKLAEALLDRLNHTGFPIPPEDRQVRLMCAVALGRMKAPKALQSLRKYCPDMNPVRDPVQNACGWAISQLTGAAIPPPKTIRIGRLDWFLLPDK